MLDSDRMACLPDRVIDVVRIDGWGDVGRDYGRIIHLVNLVNDSATQLRLNAFIQSSNNRTGSSL